MMWGYYPGTTGMAVWMIIMSLLWLGVVGTALWALFRYLNTRATSSRASDGPDQGPAPSALEILRQRYARGEVDDVTFTHMRDQLETAQQAPQPIQAAATASKR